MIACDSEQYARVWLRLRNHRMGERSGTVLSENGRRRIHQGRKSGKQRVFLPDFYGLDWSAENGTLTGKWRRTIYDTYERRGGETASGSRTV